MLGIGQLECVSYGVVCGVSYCVDNEKALIIKDDCQECEMSVKLHILIIETHLGRFRKKNSLLYACRSNYFICLCIYL